ncbi:DUF1896 domain-containing protein [Chryseobacterium sp. CKR4-1]|uniref:DUF1896 domain-containing protein n=1 Tax=Chryseobacterium sp. CKR4-1 TaxID=3068896 RepID=UPI002796B7DB|nr:DUF1896 domain-containing protein [Chryseobacterium sp. CKR4-1]MDQ1803061.1 DUF1896 domain-containing protein [Chryseobacterium sp. CKR4-1]
MSIEGKDLSYFTLRLLELLVSSFPEKVGDTAFVEERSANCASVYEQAFKAGNSHDASLRMAEKVLFEGLHFSRYDTLFKVVCNEFDRLMADEELQPFAMKMLPVCEEVFKGYILTDDFQDHQDYELLYTELTGTIQLWIEDHGL